MAESKILQKIGQRNPQLFIDYIIENIVDLDDKQFSNEDLQYILTPEFLNSGVNLDTIVTYRSGFEEGKRGDWSFGIFNEIDSHILKKEKIPILLLNVFIALFARDLIDKSNPTRFKTETYSAVIDRFLIYIVENNEDDLFELIAFDPYKFEVFDKKVVEEINKYLLTDPRVQMLEFAALRSATNLYVWSGDNFNPSIKPSVIAAVDPSLLEQSVSSYRKPFKLIGRGNTEQAGTNDAKLEEGSRFSNFKISNLATDESAWFPNTFGGPRVSVKNAYNSFFLKFLNSIQSAEDNTYTYRDADVSELFDETIQNYLNETITFSRGSATVVTNDGQLTLKSYIAKKLLDTFRYAAWLKFAKDFKNRTDDDILNNALETISEAFGAGEEEVEESPFSVPTEGDDDVSDEDIEAKQKFLKQCMLMTRLDDFANENLKDICNQITTKPGKIHKKNKPYSNRFYMVQDDPNGDQSAMINKLIIPPGDTIREFLDMRPATHAYLIPKLRFYKVYTDKQGKISEFRFHFANFTDPNRIEKLSNSTFDRGGDYGVKSFDFSFEGATPATAKNDIKANLSLYFQSFGDFVDRKFSSGDGEKHAFVDLLLLPSGKQKEGSGSPSIFQFAAKYYRIRVDVGWEIASSKIDDLNEAIGTKAAAKLTESLKKMNKSFLLNMIDHTMEFKDDGSIQIDVEYRAYIESALKGTTMDALASKEAREALKVIRKDYEKIVSANKCSAEELNEIRLQLEQIEDLFVKQSYQSIMKRLIENGSIKFKKAKDGSSRQFLSRGILTSKVEFISTDSTTGEETTLQEASKTGTFLNSDAGFVDLKNNDDYLYINYFYLGDLLYAIGDCMYDDSGNHMEGLEKFKFVLGSFDYEDLLENNNPKKTINLANIPISCELFYEWFTENVIKPERNSYPIMYFIRDLCKFLIVEILSETCFKRSLDKSLQFKTMNFLGKKTGSGDPLGSLYVYNKDKPENLVLNLSKHYGSSLPLSVDDENIVSVRDVYNYMTIYVETPRLKSKKDKTTTKREDEAEGIMHYQIGRDRGILKKIKFSKSDMQYIREARFFRHGNDGLMQLSAVYKVTMEMVGNTLYYPGMEIFIDPLGLLGADLQADPRERNSIANRLGFGGYHLITNVKSSIGPGKFTTTVDALFSYSGDGDPSSRVTGTADEIKKSKEKSISEKADNRSAASKKFCADVYDHVITEAILIDDGNDQYNPIDFQPLENEFNTTEAVEADREERADEAVDMTAEEILEEAGATDNSTETPLETLQRQAEEEDDNFKITTYPDDIY
jgi:hypothetical protein